MKWISYKIVEWDQWNTDDQKGGLEWLAQTAHDERYVVRACSLPLDSYSALKKDEE